MYVTVTLLSTRTVHINTSCIAYMIPDLYNVVMANGETLVLTRKSFRELSRKLGIEVYT